MAVTKSRSQAERWRDFFEVLILAFTLALFLRTFFVGFYRVSTGNMAPNLRVGDFVWVSKVSYGLKIPFTGLRLLETLPARGDLVLFRYPDQSTAVHIKRVIGLPGDHIHILQKQILVNDTPFKLVPIAGAEFSDVAGSEFMHFFQEDNGLKSYPVMYAQTSGESKDIGPLVVPPGEVFVVGDNRDASDDSRYWGSVPMTHVEAKMKGIWFSLDWSQTSKESEPRLRWHRLKFD
jgi:signal peptidase I